MREVDYWGINDSFSENLPDCENGLFLELGLKERIRAVEIAKYLRGENKSNSKIIGRTFFKLIEKQFTYLFCVNAEFEDEILCKVVQCDKKDTPYVMIFVNEKLSLTERMVYTLCGFYWYITQGVIKNKSIYTISRNNKMKAIAENLYFTSHYLLPDDVLYNSEIYRFHNYAKIYSVCRQLSLNYEVPIELLLNRIPEKQYRGIYYISH